MKKYKMWAKLFINDEEIDSFMQEYNARGLWHAHIRAWNFAVEQFVKYSNEKPHIEKRVLTDEVTIKIMKVLLSP